MTFVDVHYVKRTGCVLGLVFGQLLSCICATLELLIAEVYFDVIDDCIL